MIRSSKKALISVMARGVMERTLNPEQLNQWFDSTADAQYTKDLLFSSLFDIMSKVVLGSHRSVHAAYQATEEDIGVSITSVYNKLNGIEPHTSAQLVRYAVEQAQPLVKKLSGKAQARCRENGSSCLTATASKKLSTASKSCDHWPQGRCRENHWWSMTL